MKIDCGQLSDYKEVWIVICAIGVMVLGCVVLNILGV